MNETAWARPRVRTLVWFACALVAGAVAGCSSDDGGAAPGGGSAGGGAAGGDAGADVTSDAADESTADAASEPDAAEAGAKSWALFVGSDFSTTAELAVVDLAAGAVAGRLTSTDQDTLPYASGGRGFALHRTAGTVDLLDAAEPWKVAHTVSVNDGDASSNPYAAVVAAGAKGYVVRFAANSLDVIDTGAGTVTGQVDLSSALDANDPDGLVDVLDGAYDAASGRAYFLLSRIDQFDFSGPGPDYVPRCLPVHAMIVAVDAQTDALVDLNGAAAGEGLELLGENPSALATDLAAHRLVVMQAGCYEPDDGGADAGVLRAMRGIEAVDLATGTSSWLYTTTDVDRLSYLLWIGPTQAYVGKGYPTAWYAWDPTSASLGAAEPSIPSMPVWDGTRIVGLASGDAVAFDPTTKAVTTLASGVFATPGVGDYGSAIVR